MLTTWNSDGKMLQYYYVIDRSERRTVYVFVRRRSFHWTFSRPTESGVDDEISNYGHTSRWQCMPMHFDLREMSGREGPVQILYSVIIIGLYTCTMYIYLGTLLVLLILRTPPPPPPRSRIRHCTICIIYDYCHNRISLLRTITYINTILRFAESIII